jgi:hypothetical protein
MHHDSRSGNRQIITAQKLSRYRVAMNNSSHNEASNETDRAGGIRRRNCINGIARCGTNELRNGCAARTGQARGVGYAGYVPGEGRACRSGHVHYRTANSQSVSAIT